MTWSCARTPFPLDEARRAQWERLAASSPRPHPQQTWWWAECWARHFRPASLELLALSDGGSPRALLPLATLRQRDPHALLGHSVLTLAGDGFSDALPLLAAPGDLEALEQAAAWLDARRGAWDETRLSPLIESEAAWPLLDMLRRRGWSTARVEGNPLLDLGAGWDGLLRRVGRNLRHDVEKKRRRLEEAGLAPRLELERQWSAGLLAELEALVRRRHQAEGRRSPFLVPARRAFIDEICALAAARGHLACFLSRDGERLLAFRLGFLYHDAFFDWITSYDPELFPFSIGKLLLWDVVERLCELGARRLDFMAGEEDYKLKWQPEVRGMHHCCVRRASAANLARALTRAAGRARAAWRS